MMPKPLSEAAAWRKLAEWCGSGKPTRRNTLCWRLNHAANGDRCAARPNLREHDALPADLPVHEMFARITEHTDPLMSCHLDDDDHSPWLSSPKRNDARVIFCLLMALECEGESK